MQKLSEMQLGKQGITENFISSLQGHFEKHDIVKVHVLKSAGHDKDEIRKICEEILEKLGTHFTAKIIGFTIVVKKWRKARR